MEKRERYIAKKKMKRAKNVRTICEVLRDINDLVQSDQEPDNTIRELLLEAEVMGKKITRKLYEYSKKWNKDFYDSNPDFEEKLKLRLNKSYLTGRSI